MNPVVPRTVACALGWILALQYATTAFAQSAAASENAGSQQSVASTPSASTPPATSTEDQAPGNATSASQETSPYPQAPEPQTQDARESLRVQQTKETAKSQNPDGYAFQQPQGAAAARLQPTTGTAASQPGGAALAPARQKRSHSLLIRLGVLAAASVAVGAVVALSEASPGKPPGSR